VTAKRTQSGKSAVGTLTSQLRVPANDRLQKIHNTGIALAKLRADGAIPAHTSSSSSNGVTAKDIVDGHQVHTATTTVPLHHVLSLQCMLGATHVHQVLQLAMTQCDRTYFVYTQQVDRASSTLLLLAC
jgi:hypothetical protein